MDVREKLVEIVKEAGYECERFGDLWDMRENAEEISDFMIAHGVTVQEWISVDDRLPETKENAICLNGNGDVMIGTYTEFGWMFPCYFEKPTYWMRIPQPPKGE